VHREDSREGQPEITESKIVPVLSENKPEESACPEEQSEPSSGNHDSGLSGCDHCYSDDEQASDCDPKELGGFQDETEDSSSLSLVNGIH
jgi:hypothetical protein